MAIIYGNYTATKAITVPYPISFDLTARGNGSGVCYLFLKTSVNTNVKVTGAAKLYDDTDGTVNEATSKALTANSQRNVYVKLGTGTAKIYLNSKKLTSLYVENGSTDQPKVSGDFSNLILLTTLSLVGRTNFNSSVTKLASLIYIHIGANSNEGAITGSLNASGASLTTLSLVDYEPTKIEGASISVTGNFSLFSAINYIELVGNLLTFSGVVRAGVGLFYGSGNTTYTNVSYTIDASSVNLYYIENDCPNINVVTLVNSTLINYVQLLNVVMSTAVVNQLLADILANIAVVKPYSQALRTYDLSGAIGTGAPSGQGLIDKQAIIDYVTGGVTNNVTTR